MKETDYTLKKEVLRFPVYSVGTIDEGERGEREREKEREKVIAVDIYRYGWRKGCENRSNFWEDGLQRLNMLINYRGEAIYSYIISIYIVSILCTRL